MIKHTKFFEVFGIMLTFSSTCNLSVLKRIAHNVKTFTNTVVFVIFFRNSKILNRVNDKAYY
uniref:Uncharacterized protein n=1 Tax=Human betaherpesvirus 6A TaxID=32603 RepID=A0A2L2QDU6_9BETA|nr:hypothetical protein [Human betaherpesvirus 6A]